MAHKHIFHIARLGFAVYLATSLPAAYCCSVVVVCNLLRPPANNDSLLFTGKVISASAGKTTFAVDEDFGTANRQRVTVTGGEYTLGHSYVVEAGKNEKGGYESDEYCLGHHELRQYDRLPEVLRALRATPAATDLRGAVWARPGANPQGYDYQPYPGVSVVARSETGEIFRTQTDELGIFYFHGLVAGHYEVTTDYKGDSQPNVRVIDFPKEKELDLGLSFHGSISGTSDCASQLGCYLQLLHADNDAQPAGDPIEVNGEAGTAFTFDQLAPGDYILAEYQDGSPGDEDPFLPMYYPQASRLKDAKLIHIGLDEHAQDLFMKLAPAAVRNFKFKVATKDGRTGKELEADIEYLSAARFVQNEDDDLDSYTYTNTAGAAEVTIVGDAAVIVHFYATIDSIKYEAAVKVKPLSVSTKALAVVLTPAKNRDGESE